MSWFNVTQSVLEQSNTASSQPADDRIKVLLLITSTAGGVGLLTAHLARDMSRTEFDVTVAFGPGYPADKLFDGLGVPVVHLSLSRRLSPLTNLRGMIQLHRYLKHNRFDVVCTACSIAGCIGRLAAWARGVPHRVFAIHLFASQRDQAAVVRSAYRWLERGLDRVTTRYIAVSEAMKQFGAAHRIFDPDKVEVIYNGIDIPEPVTEDPRAIREAFGLQPDAPVIGTLARFEPQKGVAYLLRAAAIAREQVPDLQVLIAGDGPLKNELENLAQELGVRDRVRFVGWRDDIYRVLAAMDVFCLPSLWESFGLVLTEAMAMERPIVATDIDGVREVVVNDQTGVLVPPRDPQRFAQAAVSLLQDRAQAQRMGSAGRRRVVEHFSSARMVEQYEAFFRRLVGREHTSEVTAA